MYRFFLIFVLFISGCMATESSSSLEDSGYQSQSSSGLNLSQPHLRGPNPCLTVEVVLGTKIVVPVPCTSYVDRGDPSLEEIVESNLDNPDPEAINLSQIIAEAL